MNFFFFVSKMLHYLIRYQSRFAELVSLQQIPFVGSSETFQGQRLALSLFVQAWYRRRCYGCQFFLGVLGTDSKAPSQPAVERHEGLPHIFHMRQTSFS